MPMPIFDAQAFLRRRTDQRRFAFRLGSRAVGGALVGVLGAALTLWLDREAGLSLPFPPSNSQALLGTLVGAMITITVFVLWMRMVVVGLASGQASPRVLTGYLDDAFQRNLTAWMVAGFSYLTAVTVAMPFHPDGQGIPAVSSVMSLLVVLAALSTVLMAMHNATSSLSMPQIVRSLADRAFDVMGAQHSSGEPPPSTAGGAMTMLRAPRMGWVQWIEHEAIMDHLPPGTVLTVDVNVSDFVAEDEPVAWADADLADDAATAILRSFTIVPARASEYDLAYAVQQLVDVAEHAMTPSSVDTSTAYEALVHLRAVFHRLLHRGTATGSVRGEDGRWIVARRAWEPADHLRAAFQRLVTGGSQDPTTAAHLRATLTVLERTAHEVGDAASEEVLSGQLSRLEDEARSLTAPAAA